MSATVFHGTTILGVRKDGRVALGGDGQVSMGETVFKSQGSKVRALKGGKVLAGFAGWTVIRGTCREPPSSWPRTGAATGCSGGWRPCSW
jgi:hypothetical protein